jgi:hypothetical protein
MTEITVDPAGQAIGIEVQTRSLHTLAFEIEVYSPDGSTILESLAGDTRTHNPFTGTLRLKPAESKHKYISGSFTVRSPDGRDNKYDILFKVLSDKKKVQPEIPLTGITVNGEAVIIANIHIV